MSFKTFHLDPRLLQGLSDAGYTEATALQSEVLSPALDGKSMLVRARSGQGKDGAFLIPLLSRLASNPSKGTKAVILTSSPPRVAKIDEQIWVMGYHAQIESVQLVFKGDRDIQNEALKNEAPILISNPRYFAEICQSGRVNLQNIELLVLDDLDILLHEGDAKHLYTIIEHITAENYQTLAFADRLARSIDKVLGKATNEIVSVGFDQFELRKSVPRSKDDENKSLEDAHPTPPPPVSVPDAPPMVTEKVVKPAKNDQKQTKASDPNESSLSFDDIPAGTKQAYIRVPSRMKITTLTALVDEQEIKRMVVFTASKRGSDRLFRVFKSQQVEVVRVNSRQSEEERTEMVDRFNKGEANFILVSEIPIEQIALNRTGWVINYDVPDTFADYVQRMTHSTIDGGLLNVLSLVSDSDTDSILRLQDKQPEPLRELPLPERAQKKYEEKKARAKRPADDEVTAKGQSKRGPRNPGPAKAKPVNKKKSERDDRSTDKSSPKKGGYRKGTDDKRNTKGGPNQKGKGKPVPKRKRTEAAKLTELPQANFDRLDKSASKSTGFFGKLKKLFGG